MDLQKKRASTLVLSSRSRQSSSSRKLSPVPCSKCVFCRNECTTKHQQTYFPNMINKALYSKYSSSQNYYYTRGLNEFLTNARTTNVIRFKDTLQFEEEEEYLKRFYKRSEYPGKIDMLTEYYKFHKDIARMFMLPSTNTVNRYHDKKRRLEYIRVTKMLKDQNKNDLEMPKTERLKSIPITDRVLDDLELTQSDTHNINRRVTTEVSEVIRPSATKRRVANKENNAKGDAKKSIGIQEVKVSKDVKGGFSSLKKPAKNKEIDQSGDLSGSQTIQELNWKLGEIIHNSYSQNGLDVLSYFENSEQQPNDTISNLNNFLEYIQTNAQSSKLSRIPAISSVIPPAQDIKSLPNTHRSPDPEPKSTASSTKLTIKSKNPSTSQVSYNNTNQFIPEATLATELLRRVSLDQPRKGSKKVIYTDIDRPLTTVTTTRASVHPTPSAARSKNKATPVSIKIQGFEEALRSRQPTSPRQLNSQHSTSRERVATKFSSSLSHRAGDIKSIKYSGDANMRGGVLTSRRESQTNSNLMKVSHKTSAKKKESFNNAIEKNVDMAVHTSQNMTTRPSSHRDMRISLDMYAINRHMSQPGMVGSTITTTYTEKTEGNYVKIQSSKAKPNTSGVHKVKDIKHLSTLGNMDIQDKDIRSVPSSKPSVRAHLTSRGDYRSSNRIEIIPEQDIINLKRSSQQGPRKALTHRENNAVGTHKSHKSEVKFGKFEASGVLMKKGSLPQSAIARDAEQALYEERRYTKDRESSPSKHGYTYNHNNIVNIYVQSRPDTTTSKENIRGMGLGKANTRKSDAFEIASKQTSCRESPSIMSKKEEGSSIKMKNIYGNTYAKPVLPARTKGKVELDLMEKRIKVSDDNHYEILLKIKGK